MKFNYDLYRPKKFIQDAWKSNSAYFHSKDVRVTPHTKIGDADKVYKSRSIGRFPALAKRLKPSQLVLSEILPRSKKIFVRSVDHQESVHVSPREKPTEQRETAKSRAAQRFTAALDTVRKESATTSQKSLLARSAPVLSYILLAVVMIGIGAGSVYAYIRPNVAHPESPKQASHRTEVKGETTSTQKNIGETPSITPDPPAASAPTDQAAPQGTTPAANVTPSSSGNPQANVNSNAKENTAPAPAPQNTASVTPPAPVTPPPSTPATTPEPPTAPASQPQPPTPPNNGTDTPKPPGENQQATKPGTNIDVHENSTTSPSPGDSSTLAPDNKSSTK